MMLGPQTSKAVIVSCWYSFVVLITNLCISAVLVHPLYQLLLFVTPVDTIVDTGKSVIPLPLPHAPPFIYLSMNRHCTQGILYNLDNVIRHLTGQWHAGRTLVQPSCSTHPVAQHTCMHIPCYNIAKNRLPSCSSSTCMLSPMQSSTVDVMCNHRVVQLSMVQHTLLIRVSMCWSNRR